MSSSGSLPPLPGHRIVVCSLRLVLFVNYMLRVMYCSCQTILQVQGGGNALTCAARSGLKPRLISKIILANFVSLLFILARAATAEPENIFLLGGQSNMVGHGGIVNGNWDGYVPPQCLPDPRISRFDANGVWVEAKEPIHQGIYPGNQSVVGIGPGMPFARHVLELSPSFGTIGLVPCACDWTDMDQWARGTELYLELIARAYASKRSGGRIAGLLWWQGGKDAKYKDKAEGYRRKLVQFIDNVRADLRMPELMFLMIVIPPGRANYTYIVRNAQTSINLPRMIALDVKDVSIDPDHIHVDTNGQVVVGRLLAEAFCPTGHCINDRRNHEPFISWS